MDVPAHRRELFYIQHIIGSAVLLKNRHPALHATLAIEALEIRKRHLAVTILVAPVEDACLFLVKRPVEQRLKFGVLALLLG